MQSQLHEMPDLGISVPTQIQHLFESSLAANPQATAIVFEEQSLCFEELNLKAELLCLAIQRRASNEKIIALSCTPGLSMVIGVLAILKSGKAFMPIDRAYNRERIKSMLQNSEVRFIVSSEDDACFRKLGLDVIEPSVSNETLERDIKGIQTTDNSVAYVVYTSGSVGNAKGIEIKHSAILNYVKNAIKEYSSDNPYNTSSYFHLNLAFDASLTALFVALSTGKTLVIASRRHKNMFADPNFLKFAPYDFLKITPYQFFELESLKDEKVLRASRRFVVGGETLHYRHIRSLREKNIDAEIINEYGPSETCVGCISFKFNVMDPYKERPYGVPVGKAMSGVKIFVLNDKMQKVKPGEYGEIVIGGVQVSDAYIKQPILSAQRFMSNKFEPNSMTKLYKTGDYATVNHDGHIEFVCREEKLKTIQTKQFHSCVLETEIMKIDAVSNVLVLAAENNTGLEYPLCYIRLKDTKQGLNDISNQLKKLFHKRSYPVICIHLQDFPLTSNKKINRRLLPLPLLHADTQSYDWKFNQLNYAEIKPELLIIPASSGICFKSVVTGVSNGSAFKKVVKSFYKTARLKELVMKFEEKHDLDYWKKTFTADDSEQSVFSKS